MEAAASLGERRRTPLPRLPDPLLPRARVAERLAELRARRLALVVADAGFGKTTAVACWASGTRAAHGTP